MKKLLLLSSLCLCITVTFAQTTEKAMKEAGRHKKDSVKLSSLPSVVGQYYALILTQDELVNLYAFIQQADNWSDKGRRLYLDELQKKVRIIPVDTTTKK